MMALVVRKGGRRKRRWVDIWKIQTDCKGKISLSHIPKDFLMPHMHRRNPLAEKSLAKKGRLHVKCLHCVSACLFLTSAQIVKELVG